LDLSKQYTLLSNIVSGALKDAQDLVKVVNGAVATFDAVGDLGMDDIVAKVLAGKMRSVDELGGALKAAKNLPTIFDNMEKKIPQLQGVIKQTVDKGPKFVASLQTIFQKNWLSDYKGDAATAEKISKQVFQIQTLLAKMVPQATQIYADATFLADSLGSVASTGKLGTVAVSVASYQSWTTGFFDMPCLTTGKQTFEIGPFKQTVPYPKVSYGDQVTNLLMSSSTVVHSATSYHSRIVTFLISKLPWHRTLL